MELETNDEKSLLIRVFESTTKLDTRLQYIEELLVDQKGTIKDLEKRVASLENSRNKIVGFLMVFTFVVPVVVPIVLKKFGIG